MKRPDFEEPKVITILRDPSNPGPIDGALRVSAQYRDGKVHMIIKRRVRKGEYIGKITGFSPAVVTFEDLALGEEVIFPASCISWVFR